jgi:hypothetical protein
MPTRVLTIVLCVVVFLAAALGVLVVLRYQYTGPDRLPTADMDEVPSTDPALVRYAETAQIETGLELPQALAVGPDDRIYVGGGNVVQVYERPGVEPRSIRVAGTPTCLAVAGDGTLYVGLGNRVAAVAPNGTERATWPGAGEGAIFTSIAAAGEHVLVADAGNRRILRYHKSGTLVDRIRKSDPSRQIDGVLMPSAHFDVAVGPDGLIRANDPGRLCVDVYTPDGELLQSWGKPGIGTEGFCGCCNPTDLALLPDGRIVTAEKGLLRVKTYRPDGTFDAVVAPHEAFPAGRCPLDKCTPGSALDLATDRKGRVLVLDPATGKVRIFVRKQEEAHAE